MIGWIYFHTATLIVKSKSPPLLLHPLPKILPLELHIAPPIGLTAPRKGNHRTHRTQRLIRWKQFRPIVN